MRPSGEKYNLSARQTLCDLLPFADHRSSRDRRGGDPQSRKHRPTLQFVVFAAPGSRLSSGKLREGVVASHRIDDFAVEGGQHDTVSPSQLTNSLRVVGAFVYPDEEHRAAPLLTERSCPGLVQRGTGQRQSESV